jgi:hypothetical protein
MLLTNNSPYSVDLSSLTGFRKTVAGHSCTLFHGIAFLLGILCMSSVAAAVFKCTNKDGQIEYRDTPCKHTATQREIPLNAGPTQPAVGTAHRDRRSSSPGLKNRSALNDCQDWMPPPWSVKVDAPRPDTDYSAFPKNAQGRPVISRSGGGIEVVPLEKPDALSVERQCSDMVSACWKKDNDPNRSFDACFKSAPRCTTSRPWEESQACCPDSCWQQYSQLRRQCMDPMGAMMKVFFDDHCAPGAADMVGKP